MKKVIALTLVLVLLVSLSGCINLHNHGEIIGGLLGGDTTQKEFTIGTYDGNTYTSEFLGLTCRIDSDWFFYTEEQIRELNNMTMDMAGDAYQEALKNADVVSDMFASSNDSLENVNINLEKLTALQIASIDVVENLKDCMPILKDSLESIGCSNIEMEVGSISFVGENHACLYATSTIGGVAMYQATISYICEGYLVSICITSVYNNNIDAIAGFFSTIE